MGRKRFKASEVIGREFVDIESVICEREGKKLSLGMRRKGTAILFRSFDTELVYVTKDFEFILHFSGAGPPQMRDKPPQGDCNVFYCMK